MSEKRLIKIIDSIDNFLETNPKASKVIGISMILLFYTIGILTFIWYMKNL